MAEKQIVFLQSEIKTPPFTRSARLEAGLLLRRLQMGERLALPHSRPMPTVGAGCHELRINDEHKTWRIMYYADEDAVVILDVWNKTTQSTPARVVDTCKRRLRQYKGLT
jgi:phage-related protein